MKRPEVQVACCSLGASQFGRWTASSWEQRVMYESQIPALLCRTKKAWDQIADDYTYWRKIPEAEYDQWVDRCEELDKQIQSCFNDDCYVIGDITYWRERAVEISIAELSDKRLRALHHILRGPFSDWRIMLQVWSALEDGHHVGNMLIVGEFFLITGGLGRHFPKAVLNR